MSVIRIRVCVTFFNLGLTEGYTDFDVRAKYFSRAYSYRILSFVIGFVVRNGFGGVGNFFNRHGSLSIYRRIFMFVGHNVLEAVDIFSTNVYNGDSPFANNFVCHGNFSTVGDVLCRFVVSIVGYGIVSFNGFLGRATIFGVHNKSYNVASV